MKSLVAALKHLPGKHDQKAHGRKGSGAGVTVSFIDANNPTKQKLFAMLAGHIDAAIASSSPASTHNLAAVIVGAKYEGTTTMAGMENVLGWFQAGADSSISFSAAYVDKALTSRIGLLPAQDLLSHELGHAEDRAIRDIKAANAAYGISNNPKDLPNIQGPVDRKAKASKHVADLHDDYTRSVEAFGTALFYNNDYKAVFDKHTRGDEFGVTAASKAYTNALAYPGAASDKATFVKYFAIEHYAYASTIYATMKSLPGLPPWDALTTDPGMLAAAKLKDYMMTVEFDKGEILNEGTTGFEGW